MNWIYYVLLILETVSISVTTVFASKNFTRHRTGRHVCVQQRQFAQPMPVRQSYIRPMYRQTMSLCDGYRYCPRYSLVYGIAFRTIFHVRLNTRRVYECCPGWRRKKPRDKDCLIPVCEGGCLNGGHCVAPNKCECMEGWMSKNCDTDINECLEANNCQQVCHNLPGRYRCSCHDGFDLLPDKVTCKLCFSCMPEYREMKETINHLMDKVKQLDEEKNFLMGNVSYLADHYEEAMVTMHELKSATLAQPTPTTSKKTPATTTADPIKSHPAYDQHLGVPFDRIASLSEQISLLEERLEGCTCRQNRNEPVRGGGGRRPRGNY